MTDTAKNLIKRIEKIDKIDKNFFKEALKEKNILCIELDCNKLHIYYTRKYGDPV